MFRYILSSVGQDVKLDRKCPHCRKNKANIHSSIHRRPIRDIKVSAVAQQRRNCPFCGITWTLRSEGLAHGRQRSQRLRGLGVILYMLGLSYRAVEELETAGWLEVTRRGRGQSNLYRLKERPLHGVPLSETLPEERHKHDKPAVHATGTDAPPGGARNKIKIDRYPRASPGYFPSQLQTQLT